MDQLPIELRNGILTNRRIANSLRGSDFFYGDNIKHQIQCYKDMMKHHPDSYCRLAAEIQLAYYYNLLAEHNQDQERKMHRQWIHPTKS